ncbi:aminopeptidase N [Marinobacteraceae bacterium S3BR75-40.1]
MRTSQPQTIYLKDYREPGFWIDHIDLRFELFEDGARVHSALTIRRNPNVEREETLTLDGEELTLESLAIDGRQLDSDEYRADPSSLEIDNVPDGFILSVVTWIRPQDNTRLDGLYKSSGMFCTQCEAEGFRRITYYLDRPDVMARFKTRIEADKESYPILLSNGNEVDRSDLDNGRHQVTWEDPFPKPSYLFALVAGDLVEKTDSFTTASGREVALRMYVEPRNRDKTDHAMTSLKNAMRWDEEVYGREYDLDVFMIVAVDDFNMGAMENKGLNIFNSSCVLANPKTATDGTFETIESIVAHEYFHNWSGNRVTCRDWFQLSLKEGFTVFRDTQFSSDMNSPTVKRIQDVNMLRTAQFAEDAGPMAHPIRPDSYIEISNFYTLTVYEKGAEVVRMIHNLLGPDGFRKGSDLYFERHDGQAVTTDDFVKAMEDATGRDLTQFRRWYDQAGTPVVEVEDEYDADQRVYRLKIRQSCPPTPGQKEKKPFHIPFAVGLLDGQGNPVPLKLAGDDEAPLERVLELTEPEHLYEFQDVAEQPVPSLLRDFSAPVKLRYPWTRDQLTFLMSHDPDGFNRWDAGQRLAVDNILALYEKRESAVDERLVEAYRSLLKDDTLDQALVAKMLSLPSVPYLVEQVSAADVGALFEARKQVLTVLANALRDELSACYQRHRPEGEYTVEPLAVAGRALRNTALAWLTYIGDDEAKRLAQRQFDAADNMTDEMGALGALAVSRFEAERSAALSRFYDRWKADPQVVDQWFSVQSASEYTGSLSQVQALLEHPAFDWKNPNKIRSVIGAFAMRNHRHFHAADGSGYQFLADQIIRLDDANPQIAARLCTPLTGWRKYAPELQEHMLSALKRIIGLPTLSKDVYEIVSKSLKTD